MQPSSNSAVFHPHFSTWLASSEQLERTLVANHEVLRDFLARLQAVEHGSPANHFLLVGPRGIGKTHVICLAGRYVAGRAPKPSGWAGPSEAWVCVLFAEEEYAGQNSLANFLLTLFDKLQEAMPSEPLWRLPEALHDQTDHQVIECCFERLERFHREKSQWILLLIDNLQKVLQQWSESDHQKLRSFLSRNNLLVIFGSAPSVFREVMDQKAAFHDFFEIRILAELSNEQVLDLLARRFQEDGRQAEYEARKVELARKIPAIAVLTGGNPRLVLFLYEIATRSAFLDIEVALRRLIEELREYFVRRFDELPSQARKVLDTIAQMPGPATPKEIASESRLSLALVNAQLKRLKEGHYVKPAKFQRQKSTPYDITERLFRIWRQTATVAGRQRFRFLADFLKLYFTPEEVRGLYSQHLDYLAEESLSVLDKALALDGENPNLWRSKAWTLINLNRAEEALECVERASQKGATPSQYHQDRGDLLLLTGRYAEALQELEKGLITEPGDWDLQADRLIALGCLGQQGPWMEALPAALAQVQIPSAKASITCEYAHVVALRALGRGDKHIALGLLRTSLEMKAWTASDWFGKQLGNFLRRALDTQPQAFLELVQLVRDRLREETVLRLLDPFLKAGEFLQTRNVTILERLFPEVRELVVDILKRIDPALGDQIKRLI
jgi:tetratricopeptide (TPR) repeat protein